MQNTASTRWLLPAVIAGAVSLLLWLVLPPRAGADSGDRDDPSLAARVIRSGKLRCSYLVYPPGTIKEPNSGELSGICVDTIKEVAANLGLKLEWTEEVAWSTMIEGLNTNRYDLVVAPIWPNSDRAKRIDFTTALYYSGIGAYVRSDDRRFDDNLAAINSTEVRISTIDGETAQVIAKDMFPKARTVSLPQDAAFSQMLLNVVDNKADVTFAETSTAARFLAKNPGTLRNLTPKKPLRVYGNTLIFPAGELHFSTMLNTAITELMNSGRIDALIDKYEEIPGSLYRPELGYRR